MVVPSMTILAEPTVSVVDKYAGKHNTKTIAQAYLEYLYSEEGQRIAAKHYYRPRMEKIAAEYAHQFPIANTFTIDQAFGGWAKAQKAHFDDGGTFDQIYQ